MSQNDNSLPQAINLSEISAHPAEALAALVEVMKLQENRIAHLEENQTIQASLIAKLKSRINPVVSDEVKRREEILKSLLGFNGGKMVAKEARQKMKLDKTTFSRLISHIEGVEVRPMKTDGRKHLLILRSEKG